MDILFLVHTLASAVADSDSDGGALIPLILVLSGFIFYGVMYSRYRNADKRHRHEKETSAAVANPQGANTFFQSRKGLTNARMLGANHTRVEGALNQSSGSKLLKGR